MCNFDFPARKSTKKAQKTQMAIKNEVDPRVQITWFTQSN